MTSLLTYDIIYDMVWLVYNMTSLLHVGLSVLPFLPSSNQLILGNYNKTDNVIYDMICLVSWHIIYVMLWLVYNMTSLLHDGLRDCHRFPSSNRLILGICNMTSLLHVGLSVCHRFPIFNQIILGIYSTTSLLQDGLSVCHRFPSSIS